MSSTHHSHHPGRNHRRSGLHRAWVDLRARFFLLRCRIAASMSRLLPGRSISPSLRGHDGITTITTANGETYLRLPDGTQLPASQRRLAAYLVEQGDLPTPSLNAMDTRSPSHNDIISYLIDTGHTPARAEDISSAYAHLYKRLPSPTELEAMRQQLQDFGLLYVHSHER